MEFLIKYLLNHKSLYGRAEVVYKNKIILRSRNDNMRIIISYLPFNSIKEGKYNLFIRNMKQNKFREYSGSLSFEQVIDAITDAYTDHFHYK
jgi:hypothetical protein